MNKRKFTVKAQLHKEQNQEMIEYFEDSRISYNHIKHETFHVYKNNPCFKENIHNNYLQNIYNILKPTPNSIIKDETVVYNVVKELKKYENKNNKNTITKKNHKTMTHVQGITSSKAWPQAG